MILILLIGLVLTAVAVTLVVRVLLVSRLGVAESLGRIGRYGFAGTVELSPTGGLRGFLDDAAGAVGGFVIAGLGLSAAFQLASERLSGPLGEELRIVLQEQRMGLQLLQAMENMLGRCDTPAMRSFVRAMVQGERLGVSVGQILRSLAVEMRKRRRAKAEEQAQKAPLKILFPLVFLIFPAMFVVILGPAVISVFQAFKK